MKHTLLELHAVFKKKLRRNQFETEDRLCLIPP